jgi:hypothetical protein
MFSRKNRMAGFAGYLVHPVYLAAEAYPVNALSA